MAKLRKDILPLHVFIRRRQVISAYRNLLKAAKPCKDDALKNDVINQVRTEFQRNKSLENKDTIKQCIQQATRSLRQVEEICNPQKHAPIVADENSFKTNEAAVTKKDESWINVKDSIDVRGRIGEGWPWS